MHYCYDCQRSFPRLRELRKHERVHRPRGECSECQVYFTFKEKEETHRREVNTRSFATQTEPVCKPSLSQEPADQSPKTTDAAAGQSYTGIGDLQYLHPSQLHAKTSRRWQCQMVLSQMLMWISMTPQISASEQRSSHNGPLLGHQSLFESSMFCHLNSLQGDWGVR